MNMPKFLLRCSLVAFAPIAANAAGTYYTGGYQSPQNRYTQKNYQMPVNGNAGTYTTTTGTTYTSGTTYRSGYVSNNNAMVDENGGQNTRTTTQARKRTTTTTTADDDKKGFSLDAGVSHQFAQWRLEMVSAGSILHYDNLKWNVFDASGMYNFNVGNTPMYIGAGVQYGMQYGDSPMIDDDVTNGGYWYDGWSGTNSTGDTVAVDLYGRAASIGKSSGGDMFGFNVGIGLTDFFKWGNARITPSVGYRYLKYKLETKETYGMSAVTANQGYTCYTPDGSDEVQCIPTVLFVDGSGNNLSIGSLGGYDIDGDGNADGYGIKIPSGAEFVDTLDNYYWEQGGVSHSYEVEWSGPYIALDAVYDINANNSVNGHIEIGLPSYTSTGDQPYRVDWQHPKSVEDKADMFGAFHLGLGANWMTRLTDSIMLTVGFTYDYYNVSGADATTYYNSTYYKSVLSEWYGLGYTNAELINGVEKTINGEPYTPNAAVQEYAQTIAELENAGWSSTTGDEIDSFYKSMGIRIGINARF